MVIYAFKKQKYHALLGPASQMGLMQPFATLEDGLLSAEEEE